MPEITIGFILFAAWLALQWLVISFKASWLCFGEHTPDWTTVRWADAPTTPDCKKMIEYTCVKCGIRVQDSSVYFKPTKRD